MSKNSLWLVCVTYQPNIESLQKIIDLFRDDHFVIVDNSGGDAFLGLRTSPHLAMLSDEKNIGYGAGANRGMTYAFEHGAENVVVINEDVSFDPRSHASLRLTCKAQKSAITGPVLGWIDPLHYSTDLTHRSERFYVSGSCMVISKTVFEATSGFSESYFMYYEDVDLCTRASMLGFTIQKCTVPGFRHDEKVGSVDGAREYYLSRNHLRFVMSFAPLEVKMREFFRIPIRMYRYASEKNRYAMRGIADFLLGVTGKMRER